MAMCATRSAEANRAVRRHKKGPLFVVEQGALTNLFIRQKGVSLLPEFNLNLSSPTATLGEHTNRSHACQIGPAIMLAKLSLLVLPGIGSALHCV